MVIKPNQVMVVKNRLTQIGVSFRTSNKTTATSAVFRCECGVAKIIQIASVKRGQSRSCGCYATELQKQVKHGHARAGSHTREYVSWSKMNDRCNAKPGTENWRWYGSKGISVCERWKSFEVFLQDMGSRPEGCTLDRIDGTKGYSPENCRWATPKEQSTNSGSVRLLTFNNVTKTSAEWARTMNISYAMLCKRIRRGWSVEKALTQPSMRE